MLEEIFTTGAIGFLNSVVNKTMVANDLIMSDKSIGPLQDVQEVISTVRRNADQWKFDKDKIGVIGFSAGGHLAATLSTHFDQKSIS